jgi:hypothetical protein
MSYHIIKPKKEEIAPGTLIGQQPFPLCWKDYDWMAELPSDTYFALWLRHPSANILPIVLPPGHGLYVVSFHYEAFDCDWVLEQAQKIKDPIIVLNDGSVYKFSFPDNVYFFNFYSWHIHLRQIMDWFPLRQPRNLKYKLSAVCNRITQSKLLTTTAALENISREELLIKLGVWLEEKDVHNRQPTGIEKLDNLAEIFFEKYYGNEILIDDFTDSTHNFLRKNSDPWQSLYLESAIHLTNESYHYSYMQDSLGSYIRPGPLLSEKTFKCLLAQTPFISVGQFDIYKQLVEIGLKFDYGNINLSWDSDPGNFFRLSHIIDTIIDLKNYSIQDINHMTLESSKHNADIIWSGEFEQHCKDHNMHTAETILQKFR